MTGTADTEAVEFKKIYKLDVVVIPTNKPVIRKDEDVIYMTVREKFNAIASEIEDAKKKVNLFSSVQLLLKSLSVFFL